MKGQTDLFGLLLIVLVLLFTGVIIIGILARGGEREDSTFLSTKANAMVSSLVKASSCERRLEDAMISCCENDLFCYQNGCAYLQDALLGVFEESGEEIGFSLTRDDGSECLAISRCSFGVSSSGFLLKTESGTYTAKVTLCTQE